MATLSFKESGMFVTQYHAQGVTSICIEITEE